MRIMHNGPARTGIDRRAFLRVLGLGGGTAVLAACGPSAPPEVGERVTVSFWTPGGGGDFCSRLDAIAKDFQQRSPSIHVGPTQCGTGEQEFTEVLPARIAADNAPDAAILWTPPAALAAHGAATARPADADGAICSRRELAAGGPGELPLRGEDLRPPVTAGSCGLWYNQKMFERKGIPAGRTDLPKTWDELRWLSKEFTFWKRDRLESAGFIPRHVAEERPIWSALNGAQLYDATNRRYTIDAEPNVAMMAYAVDWLNQEHRGDFAAVIRSGNWEGYELAGRKPAFMDQRQAMVLAYSWNVGDPAHAQSTFRWDIARFPMGPSGRQTLAGYWPNWLVIPKGARHVAQAFTWLDDLSGVGVKAWFSHFPDLPTNRHVPHDLLPAALIAGKGEAFAQDIMSFFRDQLDITTPMWDSPVQDFATDQLSRALDQIMYKVAQPKDALAEAQKACQGRSKKSSRLDHSRSPC